MTIELGSPAIEFDLPRDRAFPSEADPAEDPYSLSDDELSEDAEELAAMTRSLLGLVRVQRMMIDQHATAPQFDDPLSRPPHAVTATTESSSTFVLTLDDRQYDAELARLVEWVDGFLLDTYGREVSANRPWCRRWPEHPEAVARLHSLWLAYGQHIDATAGPSAMAVWHRDILDPTLAQLRAPDGPFAACGTRTGSDGHRLLEPPGLTLRRPQAA